MFKNKFVLTNCLILMVLLLMSGTSSSVAADMQAFPDDGLKNTKIEWFHTLRLFNDSMDTSHLSVDAVKAQHEKIDKILDAGINPIGAVNSWTFPDFANAPKVPGPEMHMGVPVARKDAIPSFDDPEYQRLVEIRARVYENIAAEFPEIDTWLMGYEGNYIFKDLKGEDLDLDSYIVFLLDTLESANQAIKRGNPDAVVVSHFLGRWGIPLKISGKIVQSSKILAEVDKEIAARGAKDSAYFDQMITDLVPSLADDRVEENPSQMYETGSKSSGWNTKWSESFSTATSDLTANYSDWEDVRSDAATMLPVEVSSSGYAQCYLHDINDYVGAGAKTDGVTVVPSSAQFDDNWSLKNYWTAVLDFDPIQKAGLDDPSFKEHAGVFIRVNDRTYTTGQDQTRFGTIVYTHDSNKAYLQLQGDNATNSSKGEQYFSEFYISNNPFNDTSSMIWRLQIHERQRLQVDYTYELEWKGEIWMNIYDPNYPASLVGDSDWIEASEVESKNVEIPELIGSGYLFGLIGGNNANGRMDVDFSATAWWEWN